MGKLKRSIILGLSLVSVLGFSGCGSKQEISQAQITKSNTNEENRIVALSVALVDILSELEVDLVGIPNSQYELNERVEGVTQVGLSMSPDIELIATLNPTHVLSLTTLQSMVDSKFEQAGITPTYLNVENIDELKNTITTLGDMFDRKEEAVQLITEFDESVNRTIESVKGRNHPKVLILFGFPGNYLAGTKTSFVGQMVDLLGGQNIVTDNSAAYASVNLEALVVEKPDIILRLTHGVREEVIEMFNKEFSENPIWSQFDAVKNGQVYDLDDGLFNVSASLDTAVALEELAKILYQE